MLWDDKIIEQVIPFISFAFSNKSWKRQVNRNVKTNIKIRAQVSNAEIEFNSRDKSLRNVILWP